MKLRGTYNQCGRFKGVNYLDGKVRTDDRLLSCPKWKRNKYGCMLCHSFRLYGWFRLQTVGGHDYSQYPATGEMISQDEWEHHYSQVKNAYRNRKIIVDIEQ